MIDERQVVKNHVVNVIDEPFASNHLITASLVFQKRDKDYKSPYFCFFSASPAGQNGNGKTYIREQAINFKMELTQLNALALAIKLYALGSGSKVASSYRVWADPSKNEHALGNAVKGKNLTVKEERDRNNPNDRIISIAFNRGHEISSQSNSGEPQNSNYDSIVVVFKPFEALALAETLNFLVEKGRNLKFSYISQQHRQGNGQPQGQYNGQQQGQGCGQPRQTNAQPRQGNGQPQGQYNGQQQGQGGGQPRQTNAQPRQGNGQPQGQYNNGRQQGQGNGQTRQTNQQQSRQGNGQPQSQYNGQQQGQGCGQPRQTNAPTNEPSYNPYQTSSFRRNLAA